MKQADGQDVLLLGSKSTMDEDFIFRLLFYDLSLNVLLSLQVYRLRQYGQLER